jgi:hypothetical protein
MPDSTPREGRENDAAELRHYLLLCRDDWVGELSDDELASVAREAKAHPEREWGWKATARDRLITRMEVGGV